MPIEIVRSQIYFDVLLLFLQIKNINEYRYSEKESVQLCLALLKLFLFFGIP